MINSNRKGNDFERAVAKYLRRWFPDARRQTQDQARNATESPDVKGTPFWVECKNRNKVSTKDAQRWFWKASSENGNKGYRTVLFYKDPAYRGMKAWRVVVHEYIADDPNYTPIMARSLWQAKRMGGYGMLCLLTLPEFEEFMKGWKTDGDVR